MPRRYHAEVPTSVPPDKALAWMMDLTERDFDDPRFAAEGLRRKRRIVARREGEVVAEDTLHGQRLRTTMRRASPDVVEVATEGAGLRARGTMQAEPRNGGARIVFDGEVEGEGALGWLQPLWQGSWERALTRNERLHVARMEEEWDRAPW